MKEQAVVILGLRRQSLPIIRALAKNGYPLFCFVDNRTAKEEAEYTRYGQKITFAEIEDLRSNLCIIQKQFVKKLYVFITAAYLLTEIREKFREVYSLYNVSSSPIEWIDLFSDKFKMGDFVQSQLISPIPSVLLSNYVRGSIKFPIILKRNIEHYLSFKTKVVSSQLDFDKFVATIPDNKNDIIVQEYIHDLDEMNLSYQAYLYNGLVKGDVVFQQVRYYPIGISSFLKEMCGELRERIVKISHGFLTQTSYSGFIEVEYRYIPSDGRLFIMDINTRTPASHSAFAHKFTNYAQLFAELDNPPILQPKKKMIKWVNVMSDIKWHIKERKYKGIFSFMCATWDLWSWKDPMPFCMSILRPCINKLGNLCKK